MSLILCLIILTGCGNRKMDVPQLKEPVSTTLSFRPATMRNIGDVCYLMGVVMPASYSCKSDKPVTIAKIEVGIGDYMKAGQVVATADTTELEGQLEELKNQLESLKDKKQCVQDVSKKKIEKLKYQKKQYSEDKESADIISVENEIATEKENLRYEISVIDNDISEAEKNIAAVNEEIAGLTFTAPHDGFVSYVFPILDGGTVGANENIVVISDENELYIETADVSINDYAFEKYKSKWACINGENVGVKEYPFSDIELRQARESGVYPMMRFLLDKEKSDGIRAGMTIPLFFVKDDYSKCLCVGNDSLNKDDDIYFVYVRGENDELIKREVTIGRTDKFYSEVTGGLLEGEEVFYENSALVPVSYNSVTAELTDYKEELSSEYYEAATTGYSIYIAPCNGVADNESIVSEGTEVHAGDRLLGISTVTGKAQTYEARIAVENIDKQHKMSVNDYKREKKLLEKEIKAIKADEKKEGESAGVGRKMLECDLSILKLENDFENREYIRQHQNAAKKYNELSGGSDGKGCTYITATKDGIMEKVFCDVNGAVTKGNVAALTGETSDNIVLVKMKSAAGSVGANERKAAGVGQQINIAALDNTYVGTCVGVKEGGASPQFYVRLNDVPVSKLSNANDTKSLKATFSFYANDMTSVIVIPKKAVYTETDSLTEKQSNYVWKLINNVPVKEYVTVCPDLAKNENAVILTGVNNGDAILVE
ncbi:MAG: hypothetical protein K6G76_01775 [Lachnospiraceae bacterium]|nr:hypothetical protein [Lachnospiraceae bacterium]